MLNCFLVILFKGSADSWHQQPRQLNNNNINNNNNNNNNNNEISDRQNNNNNNNQTPILFPESPSLHSSHVVMVGVPAEIAVVIALASFVIGAALTGLLCCVHHRRSMPKVWTKHLPCL
jgi:hypothetical protein